MYTNIVKVKKKGVIIRLKVFCKVLLVVRINEYFEKVMGVNPN